jgi:transcriptional regulator
MYIPEPFRETRSEALYAFIRQHSFGILSSHQDGALIASHLPFLLDERRGPNGALLGHMARANSQWQGFREDKEVLVIFPGPHAYISPSWYEAPLSVPTWNYAVVHAYGLPQRIETPSALLELLAATVRTYEDGFDQPWELGQLPEDFVSKLLRAIVGFEIRLTRLEGKFKLNQNRAAADRAGVVNGLRQHGGSLDVQVATLMEAQLGARGGANPAEPTPPRAPHVDRGS